MVKTKLLTRKYTGTEAQTTVYFIDGKGTSEEELNYNSSFEELDEEEIINRVKEYVKEESGKDVLVRVNEIQLVSNMVKLPVKDLLLLTQLREEEPSSYEAIINNLEFVTEMEKEEE